MRCLNRSGNRHSLESIEETRGNTTTHPPSNYFINGQQRQPSLRPYLTLTYVRSLQLDQLRTLPTGGYNWRLQHARFIVGLIK